MTSPIVIATRESRLALWQAEHVKARLQTELGLPARLLGMTTRGDQILDQSLSKIGGKGLFVKELEVALAKVPTAQICYPKDIARRLNNGR